MHVEALTVAYLLAKKHIVLWTKTESASNLLNACSDIKAIDGDATARCWEQSSQYRPVHELYLTWAQQ